MSSVYPYAVSLSPIYGCGTACDLTSTEEDSFEGSFHSISWMNPTQAILERFMSEPETAFFASPFPKLDLSTFSPVTTFSHPTDQRLPSPSISALDSAYASCCRSERQASPPSPPPHPIGCFLPEQAYPSSVPLTYHAFPTPDRADSLAAGCCVAMPDIQKCADENSVATLFDDENPNYATYGSLPQEGYQPLHIAEEEQLELASHSPVSECQPTPVTEYEQATGSPVIRRRHVQLLPVSPCSVAPNRVTKRPRGKRASSARESTCDTDADSTVPGDSATSSSRPFQCPLAIYGCPSSFGSKNEWKRHVSTQHLRLGFWRCDICAADATSHIKPNDFNRKDLFTQHVRRMHPFAQYAPESSQTEDEYLQTAASRCFRELRAPPVKSRCLFCSSPEAKEGADSPSPSSSVFEGPGSWDRRMEHVGQHMETAKKAHRKPVHPRDWRRDSQLENYLVQEEIVAWDASKKEYRLKV